MKKQDQKKQLIELMQEDAKDGLYDVEALRYVKMPKRFFDKNDVELKVGGIINLHQTVNGQNIFVVLSVSPLDIRYSYDLLREYEYDKESLLSVCRFTGESDWEIIGNIYELIPKANW
jgi:hypothetical protein